MTRSLDANILECKFHLITFYIVALRTEILGLLSTNRRASNDLVADVLDQSADNLVDGVTSGMLCIKYIFTNFAHIIYKIYFF